MTENNIDHNHKQPELSSPKWGWTTKLVVGITLVAIFLLLLVRFQNFLGPLFTAMLLAYLINPVAHLMTKKLKIPWRISVTVIYVLLVVIVLGLMTWGGFALVEQIQNLIRFIERNIFQLPDLVANITEQTYEIGPFSFSPSIINWNEITNEIVRAIQPAIGRVGTLAGSIAAGAVNIITWAVLIVLISYFLLAESETFLSQRFENKGTDYSRDFLRLGEELNRIWSAFIRGELVVVVIAYVIYTIMLGILGVQFFAGLAAIAAVGQLIPYLGAWVTWISFGLVALFQANVPFDVPSGIYMIIVLGVSMVANNIIDNIIRTKVMASGLKVHPSLVLIGAIIGVQLFGFIGIVIAAPMMASFKLFLTYVIRKLNDQEPFKDLEIQKESEQSKSTHWLKRIWLSVKGWVATQWQRWVKKSGRTQPGSNPEEPSHQD